MYKNVPNKRSEDSGSTMDAMKKGNSEQESTARVLVVDDDPGIRKMLYEALSGKYSVDLSPGSSDAMEKLVDYKYQILLLDARIPGIPGFEFLKYCHRSHPDMEIIVITGNPELEDAVSTVKNGAFDYISKPFSMEKLNARIQAALALRREKLSNLSLPDLSESGTHLRVEGLPVSGCRIIRTLGAGAMSSVLLVERSGRQYALKVLRRNMTGDDMGDENRLLRFLREADILSKMDHPNIVRIYHAGFSSDGKVPYILMEYVNGRLLTDIIKENLLPVEDRLLILRQIARALSAVHKQNILHRDVKPGNVMIAEGGKAKLMDFGIARLSNSSLTLTHEVLGSPAYMPPEAFEPGAELSPCSDIFSYGILAYEFLTGTKPFFADTVPHMMNSIRSERPADPLKKNPGLPHSVRDLLARMLKKNPEDRYQSMDQIISDINVILGNGQLSSAPTRLFRHFLGRNADWN